MVTSGHLIMKTFFPSSDRPVPPTDVLCPLHVQSAVCRVGASWPSGLVHRTQVLVLSENQNVGSIPGSGTCVLEQDTSSFGWDVKL